MGKLGLGQGLVGQCALEKKRILLEDVCQPQVRIHSALSRVAPRHLVILPVLFEGEVRAVLELASLSKFSATHLSFLDQLTRNFRG